jgi:hypothetical protein
VTLVTLTVLAAKSYACTVCGQFSFNQPTGCYSCGKKAEAA